jgi:DNA uptake protein ComE-like DNA-binding protein
MTTTARLAATCAAAALALALAACGGSTTPPSASTPSATANPTSNSNATGSSSSATTSAGTKVSANTASEEEIAAALASAGVSNPERWAKEVVEYRPYPTDDPNLTTLRDDLAKYNPGQETTDKIISTLTP